MDPSRLKAPCRQDRRLASNSLLGAALRFVLGFAAILAIALWLGWLGMAT